MLRNFRKELEETRKGVLAAMQATQPSRAFGAAITLAAIHLGLTEMEIRKTNNLKERRTKINEFDRIKHAIQKGTHLLTSPRPRTRFPPEDQKQYLP